MKTINPTQLETKDRKWYIIDAEGKTLGRLATKVATILRGKNKVDFAPYVDNGDYVIILNSSKVLVTGSKSQNKLYRTHSGFMGGLKEVNFSTLNEKKPSEALKIAISGMLPKNKLRADMLSRLKLELGSSHKYEAQKPTKIEL